MGLGGRRVIMEGKAIQTEEKKEGILGRRNKDMEVGKLAPPSILQIRVLLSSKKWWPLKSRSPQRASKIFSKSTRTENKIT